MRLFIIIIIIIIIVSINIFQERLALSHGTQCGFCTPGFVMSMYTLLRNTPHPSKEQIEHALEGMQLNNDMEDDNYKSSVFLGYLLSWHKSHNSTVAGNLCRCTGYRPILDGLGTFSKVR